MKKIRNVFALLRYREWVKNCFVILPLIFSNKNVLSEDIMQIFIAALLFCVASSSSYIVNDILDLSKDKAHPIKSKIRPLANGSISILLAKFILLILYLILILSWPVIHDTFFVLLGYIFLNYLYSFFLKFIPIIDIFTIAAGFVLRVLAGTKSLGLDMSSWILITTLCISLFLASIKRFQELRQFGTKSRNVLMKYSPELLIRFSEISSIMALVFYSLYAFSERPDIVLSIPFVLFGIFRYWYIVLASDKGESPTEVLLNDMTLLISILLWTIFCLYLLN